MIGSIASSTFASYHPRLQDFISLFGPFMYVCKLLGCFHSLFTIFVAWLLISDTRTRPYLIRLESKGTNAQKVNLWKTAKNCQFCPNEARNLNFFLNERLATQIAGHQKLTLQFHFYIPKFQFEIYVSTF